MKRKIFILMILISCLVVGCERNQEKENEEMPRIENIDQLEESTMLDDLIEQNDNESEIKLDNADSELVDLTTLSSTMVYAEVYQMMYDPSAYVGKTVKMNGQFFAYLIDGMDSYIFACIIQDATACCQQGMEFILADEGVVYPDDYPELNSMITVTGTFEMYDDGAYSYCRLADAQMEVCE